MKNTFTMILMAALLMLFGCQKEENPVTGSISGNLGAYDPATPLIVTPVEGIKLYLIDADYNFDTVTFTGNEAAILDSTFSDAQGNYRFPNIPLGNYWVTPVPDTVAYRFEPVPAGNSDPLPISESTPDQNISFSSPWPGNNNAGYTLILNFKNFDKWDFLYNKTLTIKRQTFLFFVPVYYYLLANGKTGDVYTEFIIDTDYPFTVNNIEYGYYAFFGILTNNYLIEFHNRIPPAIVGSYWITWPDLGSTPPSSTWEIDWSTQTITRIVK